MKTQTYNTGDEVLEIDATTGEILVDANEDDYKRVQQTKIQAFKLLAKDDFVMINGTWEAKRDGLIKILSSLPISYSWNIKERDLTKEYAQIVGTLSVETGTIKRSADAIGICELSELKGNGGLHFMNTRAETRALKRAIETLFGSVINFYVVKYLVGRV